MAERFKSDVKQMRFEIVKTRTKKELKRFIARHVHPESILFTDGWTGYNGLQKDGIVALHRRCNHSIEWVNFK